MLTSPNLTIGLFGTCGKSTWRKEFIQKYEEQGIAFFNPQVDNWSPECADNEAWHLINDDIILFPVTDETFASGSLAETGFSIASALNNSHNRFVLIYVAPDVSEALKESNLLAAQESKRARTLVLAHLRTLTNPRVILVSSLAQMLTCSLKVHSALSLLQEVKNTEF